MKAKLTYSKRLDILGNGNSLSNRKILTAFLKRLRQKFGYYSMFAALPAILTSLAQEGQAEETRRPETLPVGQTANLLERLNKKVGNSESLRRRSSFLLPHQTGKYDIISALTGGDNCPGTAIPAGVYNAANPFTDSGDTTGANNTVNSAYCYYCNGSAAGPDQIYSFTLTGVGANPRIEVSATSAAYSPMIYILDSRYGGSCPGGTNNNAFNNHFDPARASAGGTAFYEGSAMNFLPLNVPLYLFIDAQNADSFGSYTLRMRDVSIASAPSPQKPFDFDGDGRADVSVFRPSDGTWYLNGSAQGVSAAQFGLSTDKITPAHFDGDGKTDMTVYRDGTWYRINSHNNTFSAIQFGLPNDIPVPGNYSGNDVRSELAVYRGGTWWFYVSEYQYAYLQHFGLATDKPVPADYTGDGHTDLAVYRDGVWLIRDGQIRTIQFGLPSDKPVPADYDGDGKTDVAVYRDGVWYLLRSQSGFAALQFGISTDTPAPADYDGDGRADLAVFRDGIWYLLQSTNGFAAVQFGVTNDKPVPATYLP